MAAINKRDVLLYSGYALFFLFCFVMFAYFTFPYERVRHVLEAKVAAGGGPGQPQSKLTIGDLDPHWLSGVALESVEFERSAGQGDGDEGKSRIAFDELTLRVKPLSLLFGGADVAFGAEVGEGSIDGVYETEDGELSRLVAELEELDLGKLGAGSFMGVPLEGRSTGTIDVSIGKEPSGTQGEVDLRIDSLALGDGKAKVKIPGMAGGLTVDKIDAGTLELQITVRDGVATIDKMESKGKDLELSGSGSIRIARPFMASRADLTLGVKFADKYKQRNDRTKAMFELMGFDPTMKRATAADGTLRFKLTGPLNALRSAPAAAAAARVGKPARAAKAAHPD